MKHSNPDEWAQEFEESPLISRRQFLNQFAMGIGGVALAEMLSKSAAAAPTGAQPVLDHGVLGAPQFAPKAKRIIFLFMSGSTHDKANNFPIRCAASNA
jgi:hypothetical protein